MTLQFSSIKHIKKNIYNLYKPNPRPNVNVSLQEAVTFSKGGLILNEEARVTPIVLKVGMTQEGVDKCKVKRVLIDTGAKKTSVTSNISRKWG